MCKTTRLRLSLLTLAFCFFSISSFAVEPSVVTFETLVQIPRGEGSGQLMWLSDKNGRTFDGPFQGPMSFITDKNGNLWIGDSLNGRVLAFDKNGAQRKKIDLLKIAADLKIATNPVLLDMAPGNNGNLLVADAANNAIISVDVKKSSAGQYKAETDDGQYWLQINKIHSDAQGRIFVEDIPSMRTFVMNSAGEPVKILQGEVGLAVNSKGQSAMVVMNTRNRRIRHLVIAPEFGEPPVKFADFEANKPILWAAVIGFDAEDNLYAIFDCEIQRHYAVFSSDGNLMNHLVTEFPDPGYDPTRPDWISPNGEIFTVRISSDSLSILKLESNTIK